MFGVIISSKKVNTGNIGTISDAVIALDLAIPSCRKYIGTILEEKVIRTTGKTSCTDRVKASPCISKITSATRKAKIKRIDRTCLVLKFSWLKIFAYTILYEFALPDIMHSAIA